MIKVIDRLFGFLRNRNVTSLSKSDLPFEVGDRVRSIVGPWCATVVAIDLEAEHGLGRVTVRRETDGAILHQAAIAHGLEPIKGAGA